MAQGSGRSDEISRNEPPNTLAANPQNNCGLIDAVSQPRRSAIGGRTNFLGEFLHVSSMLKKQVDHGV